VFGADPHAYSATLDEIKQLLSRISVSVMTAGAEKPPPSTMKWHAGIWESYGDAEDQVQIEFNRITEAIEAICKPILSANEPALIDIGGDQPSRLTAG
jgi:hypothetical protein